MTKKTEQRTVRTESGDVFVLQKNVPVSGTYRSLGPNLRYPFAQMVAGDSFEVKVNLNDAKKKVANLSAACASYVRRANSSAKFTVRRTAKDTVRVWRIK